MPRRLRCGTGTTTKLTGAFVFFLAASGVYTTEQLHTMHHMDLSLLTLQFPPLLGVRVLGLFVHEAFHSREQKKST